MTFSLKTLYNDDNMIYIYRSTNIIQTDEFVKRILAGNNGIMGEYKALQCLLDSLLALIKWAGFINIVRMWRTTAIFVYAFIASSSASNYNPEKYIINIK